MDRKRPPNKTNIVFYQDPTIGFHRTELVVQKKIVEIYLFFCIVVSNEAIDFASSAWTHTHTHTRAHRDIQCFEREKKKKKERKKKKTHRVPTL